MRRLIALSGGEFPSAAELVGWFVLYDYQFQRRLTLADASLTVQIPLGFDIEKTSLVTEDFASGKCSISVPAMSRSVFN